MNKYIKTTLLFLLGVFLGSLLSRPAIAQGVKVLFGRSGTSLVSLKVTSGGNVSAVFN
jgi:hypothetical protein